MRRAAPPSTASARAGLSTQEYLSVLVSIVLGLGLSHLLSGVGRLIVERHRVRFYWVSVAQLCIVFLATVQFWWSTFGYGEEVENNFFAFLFFLLAPIFLYLMAALVVPGLEGESEEAVSLKEHYYAVRPWFFGLSALLVAVSGARSVFIQGDPFLHEDRAFEAFFIATSLLAATVARERVQEAVTVVTLVGFVVMVVFAGLQPG